MNDLQNDENTLLLSLSDFKRICKKWKNPIFKGALVCAALAVSFTLLRPLKYTSEATFYEKAKSNNGSHNKNAALLLLGEDKENSAIVMLKSHKILEAALAKLDYQATVEPYSIWPKIIKKPFKHLNYAIKHLMTEGALLRRSPYPSVQDLQAELVAENVKYDGEVPLYFDLHFTSSDTFTITDSIQGHIGEGRLDVPFVNSQLQFTLKSQQSNPLESKYYVLTLEPLRKLADSVADDLKIISDYKDKSFITLTLNYPTRQGSSLLLNGIMDAYREHLLEEHHRVVASQVAYLKDRRQAIERELVSLMHEHAEKLSAHAGNLELLILTQQNLQKKLLSIDLESKHIQKSLEEGSYLKIHCCTDNDPPFVHQTIAEIRLCRQQCDSIDLALDSFTKGLSDVAERSLDVQWERVAFMNQSATEAKLLLSRLEKNELLANAPHLMKEPKYRLNEWMQKFDELSEKSKNSEEYAIFSQKFSSYLTYLIHLFEVHGKTLQDRLIHQQNSEQEFQGINLETANALYLSYSRELHEAEGDVIQNQFIVDKVQRPDFELSSLSAILTDPVSHEIVKKASTIALTMQDQGNRTQRELERLNQDLDLQRNFLTLHLQQIVELLKLRTELLRSKIQAIQEMTFELLQQKISLQEKHLLDYASSRLNSLKHEQSLIYEQKQALQREFDKLPEQWATEKLIDLSLKIDGSLMQHIGSLIESKNIADHLEMSLSAPFDLAISPIHPRSPHLLLYALIGAFLGALGLTGFAVIRSIKEGIDATGENLQRVGQHVSGVISRENTFETNLESMRRLVLHLSLGSHQKKNQGRSLLLLEGKNYDYAEQLATLLSKQHLKTLILPISFDAKSSGNGNVKAKNGLLSYLEGSVKEPTINKNELFDVLPTGGVSLYGSELLESVAFQHLLKDLQQKYDWILVVSKASILGAEAEIALSLFDCAAISVTDEKLHELQRFFDLEKKTSFILGDSRIY